MRKRKMRTGRIVRRGAVKVTRIRAWRVRTYRMKRERETNMKEGIWTQALTANSHKLTRKSTPCSLTMTSLRIM